MHLNRNSLRFPTTIPKATLCRRMTSCHRSGSALLQTQYQAESIQIQVILPVSEVSAVFTLSEHPPATGFASLAPRLGQLPRAALALAAKVSTRFQNHLYIAVPK